MPYFSDEVIKGVGLLDPEGNRVSMKVRQLGQSHLAVGQVETQSAIARFETFRSHVFQYQHVRFVVLLGVKTRREVWLCVNRPLKIKSACIYQFKMLLLLD
jgi:hypothetical protein